MVTKTANVKRRRKDDEGLNSKQIASISVIVIYSLFFFVMYKYQVGVTNTFQSETFIELVMDENVIHIPPGVIRRNPQQRPMQNPPIVNDPGNSAPQSAVVAASNQSTRPKPQPETQASELPDEGDVETKTPEQKIDHRSLFQSTSKGEEENNSNNISENSLYNGVGREDQSTRTSDTPIGPDHRQPVTANLSGRSVVGSLPLPTYNSQNEGKVVVEITVDQNGNVIKANATGRGSTVQDTKLWHAAEEAAKKSRFNVKKDAPIHQIGTITYVFKLN